MGARAASRLSSRRARAAARASNSAPLASISAMTAPANASSTSSAPTRANHAIRSTLGWRRRTASTIDAVE